MPKQPENPSRARLPSGLQGPLHPGGYYGHGLELRKNEAQERQAFWDSLSFAQQLDLLDQRLGAGKGARKQRAKIRQQVLKAS